MKRLTLGLMAIVLGAILFVSGLAQPASAQGASRAVLASLSGAAEVPSLETTASGSFTGTFGGGELTFNLTSDAVGITQAHIHLGAADASGPPVVFLFGLVDPVNGIDESGTITAADLFGSVEGDFMAFAQALLAGNGYVNVHTETNPGGEVRGQIAVGEPTIAGGAVFLKWDIISLDFSGAPEQLVANPGGSASARSGNVGAAGGSITMTGSGTFAAPGAGGSNAVTGGGTWETFDNDGNSTGSGTYDVTSVVSWQAAPGSLLGSIIVDNNGNPVDSRAGLVTLANDYSDGSQGLLTISCRLPTTPADVAAMIQEGITATKGFVQYWDRDDPAPGVDANRTVFHVVSGTLPTETLTVPAGGDFVAWVFGDATASQVFEDVKAAWIWQDGGWVVFIPSLGTTDFAIPFASILFVTVDEETEIEVPARE